MKRFLPLLSSFLLSSILCAVSSAQPSSYDDISYSKGSFFGGARNDSYLLHVAVDAQGYIYGTGLCTDIPATAGAYRTTLAGQFDVMVFKLDPTMTRLIWATYIGGSHNEAGGSIAVNAQGEVFVSGYTLSPNFPTTNAADNAYLANGRVNYFALKLSADGSRLLYSRILGNGSAITQQSQSASKGAHIAINPRSEAFVFGHTTSTNYTISAGAYQTTAGGGNDLVLTKIDSLGTIVYSTFVGGSRNELSGDISYANGKVYCSGSTASTNMPLRTGKSPDNGDAFVMVADDAGATLNPRRCFVYGSSGTDSGYAICYDAHANRICLTGRAATNNFPYTNFYQAGQVTGGYVAAIDSSLSRFAYAAMIGSSITPTSIVARSNSSVYVAGYTSGSIPISSNAFQSSLRGSMDGMMISLDSTGYMLRYGTYIGGSAQDYSAAKVLLVENECVLRVIFGITTHSQNFPSSADAYQPSKLNGGDDQAAMALFSTANDLKLTYALKPCTREYSFGISVPCTPVDIIWDFGDGVRQRGQSIITHIYPRPGTYTLTATLIYPEPDTIVVRRTITVGGAAMVDAGVNVNICRKENRTQLYATGAQRYRWSPGTSVSDSTIPNPWVSPTKTTTYYVYGYDANGCEAKDSVTVFVHDVKAKAEKDTLICEGQSVLLRASGGSYVMWQPSAGLNTGSGSVVTASPVRTTTYLAIVSDGFCHDTARVTVRVNPKPHIQMPSAPTICLNTSIELKPTVTMLSGDTTGLQYQWSPQTHISNATLLNPVVSPDKNTLYRVTITSKEGCMASDSILVRVQNKLSLSIMPDTGVCIGGSLRLWSGGGASYQWSPAEGLDNPTSAAPVCTPTRTMRYTLVSTSGVCADTQHINVYVRGLPTVQAMGDTTVCEGERVRLWVQNPQAELQYVWSPSSDFENPVGAVAYLRTFTAKSYTVTATNPYTCTASDEASVRIDNALSVQAGADTSVCVGEIAVLRILSAHDSNTNFQWIPSDGVFNPLTKEYTVHATAPRSYIVQAMRGACVGVDTVRVAVRPLPDFTITPDTSICTGGSVQLGVQSDEAGISYRWLRDGADDELLDNPFSESPHTTVLNDSVSFTVVGMRDGCVRTKSLRVAMLPLPQIILPQEPLICQNESTLLSVTGSRMRSVTWQPPIGLSSTTAATVIATPQQTTQYTVSLTDSNGCVSSTQFAVKVKPRIPVSFSVSSASTETGADTVIVVYAQAQTPITTHVRFDVVCNAGIFEPTDTTRSDIDAEKRFMHIRMQDVTLGSERKEIARIKGHTMVAEYASSEVQISNAEVDSVYCPTISTQPGLLSIASCVLHLRNIRIVDLLSADLTPNPAGEQVLLRLYASERGSMQVQLLDDLGREIRSWNVEHTSLNSEHSFSLRDIASGTYTLFVKSATQQTSVRLVKSE